MAYKKIIVTGGSGRLGRFVVERLKGKYEVQVIDVKPSDVPGVAHANVDVTDLASLTKAFQGVDAVVHLAAVPNPRTSTPESCFRVNTHGHLGRASGRGGRRSEARHRHLKRRRDRAALQSEELEARSISPSTRSIRSGRARSTRCPRK